MAKMFYTLDETKAALGRSENEIKQLSKEGKLREFRDGPRLMYKADQVEVLKAELGPAGGGGDKSDSAIPLSLADSRGGSASSLSLVDEPREDTSLAADLGLSGSLGANKSGSVSGSGALLRSGTGVNVFPLDDEDPSAATAVSGALTGGSAAEVGSGSGLLDLTREGDDTSLGADLLDEISPGRASGSVSGGDETMEGPAVTSMPEPRGGVTRSLAPQVITKPDPTAPLFAGFAGGAAVVVLVGVFVVLCAVMGVVPDTVKQMVEKVSLPLLAGGMLIVALLGGGVGFVGGKFLK